MSSAMGILSVFSKEKIVFLREHRLGYYRLPAYFFAKLAVELPYQVIFPVLLMSIVYPMAGLRSGFGNYAIACIVAVLTALNGMAVGTLAATLFNSIELALVALPLILIPMMVFSGLMVNLKTIKPYFALIPVISPTQYAYKAVMKNEFLGLNQTDSKGGILPGDAFLTDRGMDSGLGVWENVLVLAGTYACLLAFSYVALHFVAKRGK
jgi:ATP-binding cassette subfamily G (WHITE) protein 1